jgi:membrane protein
MVEGANSTQALVAEPQGLAAKVESFGDRLMQQLWVLDPDESRIVGWLRSVAQLLALTIRGFRSDQLLLRASALTYVTALSIIPMLGVVFAILGVFDGNKMLVNFAIDQLTSVAPEVREIVQGYVASLNFSSFGTIGGAIVFGSSVFALRHLESTMNDIWAVSRSRNWARRFTDYLAVMVVAPITTAVAMSLGTTLQHEAVVGELMATPVFSVLYGLALSLAPFAVLFLGFTFLYWFFPNTKVRLSAAALGGAVAAVLFLVARGVYVYFQVGAATYQTVFGALSAVPLILVWLYACWSVVLLGAEIAFAKQNLAFARREMRVGVVSIVQREAVAVEIAVEIARRFVQRQTPPSAEMLADGLDEPVRLVRRVIEELELADLVRTVLPLEDVDAGYVPSGPVEGLTLGAVLRAVRGQWSSETDGSHRFSSRVAESLGRLNAAWSAIADETTLASLARAEPEPGSDVEA